MQVRSLLPAFCLLVGCVETVPGPPAPETREQAVAPLEFDHTCRPSSLPNCTLDDEEGVCCAVHSERGEEQVGCCPAVGYGARRLCADGPPTCPDGDYDPSCAGLQCPEPSWHCEDGRGCCNECGRIGPRGCSNCDRVVYDEVCDVVGLPREDVCMRFADTADGPVTRYVIRGGTADGDP